MKNALTAICPLDGRYQSYCHELTHLVSEYGLIYYRLVVEIKWLQQLATLNLGFHLDPSQQQFLDNMLQSFNENDAQKIKMIESTINHDVKAVEYFIKQTLAAHPTLALVQEFVHFGCTSEDINNLAYGLMLNDLRKKVLLPLFDELTIDLKKIITPHTHTAMLARTHGQAASPTTLGKEIANVVARLERQMTQFQNISLLGKINGAVGNFNAHVVAYPEIPWAQLAQQFVESLGLSYNPMTTQIEPHDSLAEYFHCLIRLNTILIDFSRDMWGYIALGYFKQKTIAHEVGSSTMPHKINPIDFENAEGNLGLANALFSHFAQKLPISRWQRDLSDSTVLRNVGVAGGYLVIALKALLKGLKKLEVEPAQLQHDLENNWQVLGEAIQSVLRRYQLKEPYEQLKALTRGKKITLQEIHTFIDSLSLAVEVKQQLKALTPANYTGLAEQLTQSFLKMQTTTMSPTHNPD